MKIGYIRISKGDGSQKADLQYDALRAEGVALENIFEDQISGAKGERSGLSTMLRALRSGDQLIIWSLDRLGRNLRHLINLMQELQERQISIKILSGQGAGIDTSTPHGKMVISIFGALAEFERELIRERTIAGLRAARARGRHGGRKYALTKSKIRLAEAAMGKRETCVSDLCKELGISKATLYRYVGPDGQLRELAIKALEF